MTPPYSMVSALLSAIHSSVISCAIAHFRNRFDCSGITGHRVSGAALTFIHSWSQQVSVGRRQGTCPCGKRRSEGRSVLTIRLYKSIRSLFDMQLSLRSSVLCMVRNLCVYLGQTRDCRVTKKTDLKATTDTLRLKMLSIWKHRWLLYCRML